MFTDSAGCQLKGFDFTSKLNRLSLALWRSDLSDFKVAFNDVVAFNLDRRFLGEEIKLVRPVPLGPLLSSQPDKIESAIQWGIWPNGITENQLASPGELVGQGFSGFQILFCSSSIAWVISRDFILLGRKPCA
jgi:hypothetical protein